MPDTAHIKLREAGPMTRLDRVIADAVGSLASKQRGDGHWAFELEADVTITAEYIMLEHFLDDIDEALQSELAHTIRALQGDHGGWPLFHGGQADLSATVKAYLALRLAGDRPQAPHMRRAREVVLALGGAEKSNVFTRYALALFGQVPWRAVPVMPIELMLLPKWFPITVWRFSYWSRTVIAPLLLLAALKPRARNPRGVTLAELFRTPPFEIRDFHKGAGGSGDKSFWAFFFLRLDRVLRVVEPHFPKSLRQRAIARTVEYFSERLNGEDGLGAIFPAMANAVMAMDAMGYERGDARFATALRAIRGLLVRGNGADGRTYCQPCLSPVWDTALAALALLEAGADPANGAIPAATRWLRDLQVLDVAGDWAVQRPDVRPGGWAFQYRNDHFPDVDDTAVVGMLLDRTKDPANEEAIARAAEWIIGLQSESGGWGSFDADNDKNLLNSIPFADHGALLDQPTEDVTARCVSFLAQIGPRYGYGRDHPALGRGLEYLLRSQQQDGSWWGRWGTNYIYGTWSVLSALNMAGGDKSQPHIRRAVDWLLAAQRSDGGWGEDGATYWQAQRGLAKESTPSQTAWALLALMAVGEVHNPAVARGVDYLVEASRNGDKWVEPWFTAVGFPRVFYLRYDGYSRFFPVWALARYRNLLASGSRDGAYGM